MASYDRTYILYDGYDVPLGYHTSFRTLLNLICKNHPDMIVTLELPGRTPNTVECVQVGKKITPASKSKTMFTPFHHHGVKRDIPTWRVYLIDPNTEHYGDYTFHVNNTGETYVEPRYEIMTIRQFAKLE